jgi:hypothetical protein
MERPADLPRPASAARLAAAGTSRAPGIRPPRFWPCSRLPANSSAVRASRSVTSEAASAVRSASTRMRRSGSGIGSKPRARARGGGHEGRRGPRREGPISPDRRRGRRRRRGAIPRNPASRPGRFPGRDRPGNRGRAWHRVREAFGPPPRAPRKGRSPSRSEPVPPTRGTPCRGRGSRRRAGADSLPAFSRSFRRRADGVRLGVPGPFGHRYRPGNARSIRSSSRKVAIPFSWSSEGRWLRLA